MVFKINCQVLFHFFLGGEEKRSHRVTKSQSHEVTKSRSHEVTESQSHEGTESRRHCNPNKKGCLLRETALIDACESNLKWLFRLKKVSDG
jgi:hypothetical protein